MKGLIHVGATQSSELKEKFNIKDEDLPIFKLFPYGDHDTPIEYTGPLSPKSLADWALSQIPSFVEDLTVDNIDKFLTKNPSKVKVLLFHDKPKIPALFNYLSMTYRSRFIFGFIKKSETALARQFNVNKFPRLLLLEPNNENPIVYTNELKLDAINKFLKPYSSKIYKYTPKPIQLKELTSSSHLSLCGPEFKQICVIISSTSATEGSEALEIAKKYQNDKFIFSWINKETQKEWITQFEQATAVIINPKKNRYLLFHQDITDQSLFGNFLDRILGGDVSWKTLTKFPNLQ